jgi:ankyrin repeat protein
MKNVKYCCDRFEKAVKKKEIKSTTKGSIVTWHMGKMGLLFCPFCGASVMWGPQSKAIPEQRTDTKKKTKKKRRPGVDKDGRNELHRAVLVNDIARVQQLMASKKIDVNEQDDEGFSALHLAAQEFRKDIVRILLDNGAVVDIRDDNGNTPLTRSLDSCYEALTTNVPDPGAIIKMLLQAGADPKSQNNYGVKIIDTVKWGGPHINIKQFFNKKNWK